MYSNSALLLANAIPETAAVLLVVVLIFSSPENQFEEFHKCLATTPLNDSTDILTYYRINVTRDIQIVGAIK